MSLSPPPLVSVVMPVRNGAATLDRAVASVVGQTLRDLELLIVNDGSTDETAERARTWMRRDDRIRLCEPADPGLVAALNHGVACARASLIARMDSDDESLPLRLAKQVEWLQRHPDTGLVSCLVRFGGDPKAAAGYALHVDWLNGLCSAGDLARNRFIESPLAHPSVCFRRDCVTRLGGYRDGPFPEDYELWLRWLEGGVRMEKVPEVLLQWNDGPRRLSRTDPRYSPHAFFQVKATYVARETRRLLNREGVVRDVWVWGAGRPTRKRAGALEEAGLKLVGYIDVDPKKTGRCLGAERRPVVGLREIPPPERAFVLGYVSSRGARDFIRDRLCHAGYLEGSDFLMCA